MTFQFDTSGVVMIWSNDGSADTIWRFAYLSPFVQGYVEAMPWEALSDGEFERQCKIKGQGAEYHAFGFSDLAPETLARIMSDCAERRRTSATADQTSAGAAFWAARQSGFKKWGWPSIEVLPRQFPPLIPILGDDGKIYFKGE